MGMLYPFQAFKTGMDSSGKGLDLEYPLSTPVVYSNCTAYKYQLTVWVSASQSYARILQTGVITINYAAVLWCSYQQLIFQLRQFPHNVNEMHKPLCKTQKKEKLRP